VKPRSLSLTEDVLLTKLMDYSNLLQQETNERLFYKVQEMRHSLTRC
jgi:hypothetical protein